MLSSRPENAQPLVSPDAPPYTVVAVAAQPEGPPPPYSAAATPSANFVAAPSLPIEQATVPVIDEEKLNSQSYSSNGYVAVNDPFCCVCINPHPMFPLYVSCDRPSGGDGSIKCDHPAILAIGCCVVTSTAGALCMTDSCLEAKEESATLSHNKWLPYVKTGLFIGAGAVAGYFVGGAVVAAYAADPLMTYGWNLAIKGLSSVTTAGITSCFSRCLCPISRNRHSMFAAPNDQKPTVVVDQTNRQKLLPSL